MIQTIQPEALNCPNCGGAVMSDKTQCEFCGSRLKTVGCSKCLGLMFLGAKFCSHCGAKAGEVTVIPDTAASECPRCKQNLKTIGIGSIIVRECTQCGGLWTAAETFETICADQESQASVLGFIGSEARPNSHPPTISYVPCPDCKLLMNRSNFARSSGVIVDMCKQHGVWFDADELPKIIDFINKGGMARSREKEKMSIADGRQKLRDDQRRLEMIERRSGTRFKDEEDSPILSNVLGFLFD
jgi:Zn-finger nucleic acid-binding protein